MFVLSGTLQLLHWPGRATSRSHGAGERDRILYISGKPEYSANEPETSMPVTGIITRLERQSLPQYSLIRDTHAAQ